MIEVCATCHQARDIISDIAKLLLAYHGPPDGYDEETIQRLIDRCKALFNKRDLPTVIQ